MWKKAFSLPSVIWSAQPLLYKSTRGSSCEVNRAAWTKFLCWPFLKSAITNVHGTNPKRFNMKCYENVQVHSCLFSGLDSLKLFELSIFLSSLFMPLATALWWWWLMLVDLKLQKQNVTNAEPYLWHMKSNVSWLGEKHFTKSCYY